MPLKTKLSATIVGLFLLFALIQFAAYSAWADPAFQKLEDDGTRDIELL